MAIEHDPWIHPNLKGQPDEPDPIYESKLIVRANRSITLGVLGLMVPLLPFLIGGWLARGFMGLGIILCTPLTIIIGAVYGIISANKVKKETRYKSLAYNRAFSGQVLNSLSLIISAVFLLMVVLLLLFVIGASPSWK